MPEVRLIDANALHAKILEENRNNYAATENVAQILLRIETAPTIDPEVLNFNSLGIDIESIETRFDEEVTNEPDELHALENLERIYGDIMDAIKKLRGNT